MLLKPIQNNYLSFQFVNLLEERLKGYRFGKHVMLLLKTILEIYFKLAALTNFSGVFFSSSVEWGRQIWNSCLWLGWISSIAFTLGRKMFSSCLGKSSLHCSKNNRSKSPYFILAARKLEREENNRGEANCGTTPLRQFFSLSLQFAGCQPCF